MPRLKMFPWFALWAVVTAVQLYFAVALLPPASAEGDSAAVAFSASVLVLLAFQLVKVPLSMPRLNDLGRPTDDAFLGLVPLVNLGLWAQLFGATPSEAKRDKLREQWIHETSALAAAKHGAQVLFKALPALVPLLIVCTAVLAVGDVASNWFLDSFLENTSNEALDSAVFFIKVLLVGCVGICVLLLPNMNGARRTHWLPGLLILPLLMFWGTIAMRDMAEMKAALVSLPFQAIDLVISVFFGSLVAIVWMTFADRASSGRSLGFDSWNEVFENVRKRAGDVIAVNGGATLAIAIGMQVVIPGIHYMLVYAFANFQVFKYPDARAFKESSKYTSGIRRRLFLTMLIPTLVYAVFSATLVVIGTPLSNALAPLGNTLGLPGLEFGAPYDAGVWFTSTFLDPRAAPRWVDLVLVPAELLRAGCVMVALWPIWLDRRHRLGATPDSPLVSGSSDVVVTP